MSDDADFEEQIRLQQAEEEKRDKLDHGRTKTDEDGTVMEWDADRGAWFPKVSNKLTPVFISGSRGRKGRPTPRSNFFDFHAVFRNNWLNSRLAASPCN